MPARGRRGTMKPSMFTASCYTPGCPRNFRPWIRHKDANRNGRLRCPTCHGPKVMVTERPYPSGAVRDDSPTVTFTKASPDNSQWSKVDQSIDKIPLVGRLGEEGGHQGNLSVGAKSSPASSGTRRRATVSRKRTDEGWLVPVTEMTNGRLRRNPPEKAGNVSMRINGLPEELRIRRWKPNRRGSEYVQVTVLERRWNLSDPDQLRCAIANGMRQSQPGRMWSLPELQRHLGHGITVEQLRPAIRRMERDGWVVVVRGKPRKDSLRIALIKP